MWLAGALLTGQAVFAADELGREGYLQTCSICHMKNGQGVPGAFPPLNDRLSVWTSSKEGRRYLVSVLAKGLFGPIDVGGVRYAGAMPPLAQLGPDDMAALLNYVLKTFAAAGPEQSFSPTEVEAILAELGDTPSRALRPEN